MAAEPSLRVVAVLTVLGPEINPRVSRGGGGGTVIS